MKMKNIEREVRDRDCKYQDEKQGRRRRRRREEIENDEGKEG
jgi:hypothetical protein